MKRSAILSGHARRHLRIFAASANSCCRFCCATGGSTVDASIGPKMHLHWLAQQKFDHPAQQIVFHDAVDAIEDAATRLRRLDQQVAEIVPSWSMAPVVEAYQAMRGVSFGVAVTFVAEIGDLRRFDNPRQLMAFLGLVPSERSTGERVRRAGLTLAGNKRARRVLVEVRGAIVIRPASAKPCRPGSRGCPKRFARLPGKRKFVCAPVIAGSPPPAKSAPWSLPQLPARWQRFCGRSRTTSRPPPDRETNMTRTDRKRPSSDYPVCSTAPPR